MGKVFHKLRLFIFFLLSFLFFSSVYQSCGKPFQSSKFKNSTSSITKNENFDIQVYDNLNGLDKLIPSDKPEIVSWQSYKIVVDNKMSLPIEGDVTWNIVSIPEDSCSVIPSEDNLLEAVIQCTDDGTFSLNIKLQTKIDDQVKVETLDAVYSVLADWSLRSKGSMLYQNHCNSCHDSSGAGAKKDKSVDDIAFSIFDVPVMNAVSSLKLLSPTELRAIAVSTTPDQNDGVNPTVSITNITNDQVLTGVFEVQTSVTDNIGVVGVLWQIDNNDIGLEDMAPPYHLSLNTNLLTSGSHVLKAIARDAVGNLGFATVTFIVNTYDPYSVPEAVLATNFPVTNANIQAGEALFAAKCLDCHTTSAKRDRSYSIYRQMIGSNSSHDEMKSIDLVSEDVYKIYLYLNNFITGETTSLGQSTALIGTRSYVASYFKNIFISNAENLAADTTIGNLIKNLLLNHPGALGGACHANDATASDPICKTNVIETSNGLMLPQSSALRRGYITRACEEILSIDQSINNALEKVALTNASSLSAANIAKAYDLFLPGRPMTTSIESALSGVATNSDLTSNVDRWRFVLLAICRTAATDTL